MNFPAGHAEQLDDEEVAWNVPAPQLTHVPAAAPAYWPAGQMRQLIAPVVPTNDPEAQIKQTDDADAPTVVEYVPVGQPWQVASEDAPTVVENVPAPHDAQLDANDSPVVVE